jgi:hypothetical protein
MGLFNWLLKNGPGSPGSTASAFIKLYEQAGTVNHDEDWEGVFHMIFTARYLSFQRMGFPGGCRLNQVDADQVVQNSKGDLPLFIYIMMRYETASFRESVTSHFSEVTQVIYDVVKKGKPAAVKYDLQFFRLFAQL